METTNLYFECWHDFVDYASQQEDSSSGSHESNTEAIEWTGTESFKQALRFANNGWECGRKMIATFQEKIKAQIDGNTIQHKEHYDHSGAFVDVGRYCEGVPECMVYYHEQKTASPNGNIISIDVGLSISAMIDSKKIVRRGAAIASLCDNLEAAGKRTEINIVFSVKGKDTLNLKTTIKKPDQPLDIDCMSFALINPSVLRRLIFAVMEQQENRSNIGVDDDSYGTPMDYNSKADINLAGRWGRRTDHPQFTTDKQSADWIKSELEKQGIALEAAGC